MLPVQSIADPIPRFTVDSARYLQSFSAVLHRPNPDLRESTQRAAKFWTSDSGNCVRTHTALILESSGTGTKFKWLPAVPAVSVVLSLVYR